MVTVDEKSLWDALRTVTDPEIPVLNLVEMKIIRSVALTGSSAHVVIAPTFVGCPAIDLMKEQIRSALASIGVDHVTFEMSFSPPWSTDLLDDSARAKLEGFGIAPPPRTQGSLAEALQEVVRCPLCSSRDTRLESTFGATLCRQLYYCNGCLQSFERFKPI